jgi:ketosteroid isomerase-like protein
MSRENVELLYRVIDAFNRRDLDTYLGLMDPEVEFVPYERALEGGGAYRGHSGVRRWWEDAFAALPNLRAEIDDARDLGNTVVARGRLRGEGAGSGAAFERTLWLAVEWRGGQEVWWHAFETEAEALEAVGLRESQGQA